jgi:FtsP/CotA-like multicopper oxidase with cupredoxin domain
LAAGRLIVFDWQPATIDDVKRRDLLRLLVGGACMPAIEGSPADSPANITLRITPVTVDLAPGRSVRTVGYNGSSPGPVIRVPEGETVTFDVHNETDSTEIVHWHGLRIPSDVDGSIEEGTPTIQKGESRRYTFQASPAGTRWYHTHMAAGRNLKRGLYTGQFGFLILEPRAEAGAYDQEVLLAIHEWSGYQTSGGEGGDDSMDVGYKHYSINDRCLGFGDPIQVKPGQRILLRILNASATLPHRIGLSGHKFKVVALDGNPVPHPAEVEALELGPAERIDAIVEMNNPGTWILGSVDEAERKLGLGTIIEYPNQHGGAQWLAPSAERWDYTRFGTERTNEKVVTRVPLVFEKKFAGHHWVDKWTINGQSFPKCDPIQVRRGQRYRLVFDNRSNEAHPVHLHRHSFELVSVEGRKTAGIEKDTVVVRPNTATEVDVVADNPGPTLFHCHQQMHMDYGFMKMLLYNG